MTIAIIILAVSILVLALEVRDSTNAFKDYRNVDMTRAKELEVDLFISETKNCKLELELEALNAERKEN